MTDVIVCVLCDCADAHYITVGIMCVLCGCDDAHYMTVAIVCVVVLMLTRQLLWWCVCSVWLF